MAGLTGGISKPPTAGVDGCPGVLLEAHPTHSRFETLPGEALVQAEMALGGDALDSDEGGEL